MAGKIEISCGSRCSDSCAYETFMYSTFFFKNLEQWETANLVIDNHQFVWFHPVYLQHAKPSFCIIGTDEKIPLKKSGNKNSLVKDICIVNLTLQNILAIHGEFLEFVNTHRFRFVKHYSLSAANGVPIRHLRKHSIHGGIRELVFCPRDTGP